MKSISGFVSQLNPMYCKLCESPKAFSLGSNGSREFIKCPDCDLVFVSPEAWLSPQDEKARYEHHENRADNPDYVRYLTGISHEIDRISILNPKILDFGSGKEYVLTRVLQSRGMNCAAYDPTYDLGLENLTSRFDIIILCETIEHLRDLGEELQLLRKLCKPEGYIFIRTRLVPRDCDILKWWYAIDTTHILFFNETTLGILASIMGRSVFYSDGIQSVIIGPQASI